VPPTGSGNRRPSNERLKRCSTDRRCDLLGAQLFEKKHIKQISKIICPVTWMKVYLFMEISNIIPIFTLFCVYWKKLTCWVIWSFNE
jgi:hypothetical protein